MYSVGHLTDPRDDDKHFTEEADALEAAMTGSYDDSVWAIWDDASGDVMTVVYQQIPYNP